MSCLNIHLSIGLTVGRVSRPFEGNLLGVQVFHLLADTHEKSVKITRMATGAVTMNYVHHVEDCQNLMIESHEQYTEYQSCIVIAKLPENGSQNHDCAYKLEHVRNEHGLSGINIISNPSVPNTFSSETAHRTHNLRSQKHMDPVTENDPHSNDAYHQEQ